MLKIYVVLLCALLQAGTAYAETAPKRDVEVLLQQFKVGKHGQLDALGAAVRIQPGDVIEYQATYHNVSNHLVSQLNAILPIPKETEYVPDSARPQNVQASVDGVTFALIPLRRSFKLPNGQTALREIPTVEYRSLRWVVGDLPAHQKLTVSARIRLAPLADSGVERVKK
jgi:uncharacterized repeat protein (TIGR01451 family)